MQMNDMIMVSVDDHVVEPPHLFVEHLPRKYQERAPRVYRYPNGEERWIFDGKRLATMASMAVAGRKREELGQEASRLSEVRKGCYDVDARVDDMNANGTLSSICFPTITGFAGQLFQQGNDKDLMLALIQAYNDWHIDEWCGSHPGRFIPLGITALWDNRLAVNEIRRVARKGARSICLPENPSAFGLPSLHKSYWDPIIEACVEEDVVISVHIGSAGVFNFPSPDTPVDFANTLINLAVSGALVDIMVSPIPRKFPKVKIAMSEGCIGWLPFLMERADAAYELHHFWTNQDFGDLKPSDILKRNFMYCFHHDDIGLKYRHDIGVENICWECDYPHADTSWPRSPEQVWKTFKDMPEQEVNMITHENALRYFGFDPFKYIDRNDASVGALREKAKHIDVEPRSLGGGRKPVLDDDNNVLTAAGMGKLMAEMDRDLDDKKAVPI